jgi:hypothetical protein
LAILGIPKNIINYFSQFYFFIKLGRFYENFGQFLGR